MTAKYKDFLTKELPSKLSTLSGSQAPNFGLMTAHHMVEHLVYVTYIFSKRKGEPEGEPYQSQVYFREFIDSGCPFEYHPKEGATLKDLNTTDIALAIKMLESSTNAFYEAFETNPDFKSYNSRIGEISFADAELFNYQHSRWHLYQFGLLEEFTVEVS